MIERNGNRLRHEYKHNLSQVDHQILRSRLATVMRSDENAGPDGKYHIRSLYFDDLRNSGLFEKQAGVATRKKYRIRIYNHSDKVIKLERKNKFDSYISKQSLLLDRHDADRIIKGDIDFLKQTDEPLLRAFYLEWRRNLLRPVVLVDYYREAFVHSTGNVRITFDTGLRTGLGSTALFDEQVFTMGTLETSDTILEIKYDNLLPPHIQALFPTTIIPRAAIGKYVISRKFTSKNSWEDQ